MKKTVIFDMNGVLIDDEKFQKQSWKPMANKYHWTINDADFNEHFYGRTEKYAFEYIMNRKLSEAEVERYSNERAKIAIELFTPYLKLTEGLPEFLETLKKENIRIGIATSSRRMYLNFILDNLHLREYVYAIQTAEDVKNGKPDPEIYLKTAQKLETNPADCIVFEDTINGIKAAKAAGMKVVGVATTLSATDLLDADEIILNFKGIDWPKIGE